MPRTDVLQAARASWLPDAVIAVEVAASGAIREGDWVAAFVEDELLGRAALAPMQGDAGCLTCGIALRDPPLLRFPATLRLLAERSEVEIGPGLRLADADAFVAASAVAGACLSGMSGDEVCFSIQAPILPRYGRALTLDAGDGVAVAARSVPGEADSARHEVSFPLPQAPRPGARLVLSDPATSTVLLDLVVTQEMLLQGALAHAAATRRDLRRLEADQARLQARLDRATDQGTQAVLMQRLDLFYLLLAERLDAALHRLEPLSATPPAAPPRARHLAPGEVEGVGVYGLESDGHTEWRWFGPDVTLALPDDGGGVGRVVLLFHEFGLPLGQFEGGPVVRAWVDLVPVACGLRAAPGGGQALDIPMPGGVRAAGGRIILHLSFAHHRSTASDPRLLSAVFSGAELYPPVS